MVSVPLRVVEYDVLIDQATVLCLKLSRRCKFALDDGDLGSYTRLLRLQNKAIARWRRRRHVAQIRGIL